MTVFKVSWRWPMSRYEVLGRTRIRAETFEDAMFIATEDLSPEDFLQPTRLAEVPGETSVVDGELWLSAFPDRRRGDILELLPDAEWDGLPEVLGIEEES